MSDTTTPTTADRLARACSDAMHASDAAARTLGIEIVNITSGRARLRMLVREDMLNGHAVCHGGLVFALADTAFAHACNSYDDVTLATSCQVDFVAPAYSGDELYALAQERWRGGRTGVYDVEVAKAGGELVAMFRGKSFATGAPMRPDGSGPRPRRP